MDRIMKRLTMLAVPALTGVMSVGLALGAGPADAAITDMACDGDFVTFNACLDFQRNTSTDKFTAHVGLDSYMSQTYAQEIVANGAAFRATIWGDDPGTDSYLGDLTIMPGWPAAGSTGLGAELSLANLTRDELNEDTDGSDEIYAVISYFDYHNGQHRIFRTGVVRGEFAVGSGGGGGCQTKCPAPN